MESIIFYFIKSVFISGLLFSQYVLLLKDKRINRFNRFFLLSIFPVSIVVPFIHLSIFEWQLPVQLSNFGFRLTSSFRNAFITTSIFPSLYASVTCFLLFVIIYKTGKVFRVRKNAEKREWGGISIIETDDHRAPFSFYDTIYWRKGLDPESANGKRIMQHELVHVAQHHSYDRLTSQVLCSIFWVNPFYWRIQKELGVVHEFLADEGAFESGEVNQFAHMLLMAYSQGSYLSPDLGFNKSDIGRRINMINLKQGKSAFWRRGLVTAAILLFITFISILGNSYTFYTRFSAEQLRLREQFEQKLRDESISRKISP